MKILLIHKFFHITGGAEVFFFETARVLKENGHEVAFFSTLATQNLPSEYSDYFVNAPDYRSGGLSSKFRAINKIIYSKEAKNKLKRLLSDFRPDIVHVFAIFTHLSPSILEACKEYGVPVVMSCNDYKHICPNYKLYHHGRICNDCKGSKFYSAVKNRCCQNSISFSIASSIEAYVHDAMNIVLNNVDKFLFAGEFMIRKTEEFWGNDSFHWAKLLNPFDSTKYVASPEYSDYFIFFGRLVEEKGVDILIRAMKYAPQARLVLIGNGPQLEQLQKLSHDLDLHNIEFVGPKWGDELDSLLKLARFVVVPSIWHENFPYVIVQAFALGKAVIGSDRGGIPELIKDGEFGYIYPADVPSALADKINTLWNSPQLSVKMGKNAKDYADTVFNDEVFYNTLMDIYKGVIK